MTDTLNEQTPVLDWIHGAALSVRAVNALRDCAFTHKRRLENGQPDWVCRSADPVMRVKDLLSRASLLAIPRVGTMTSEEIFRQLQFDLMHNAPTMTYQEEPKAQQSVLQSLSDAIAFRSKLQNHAADLLVRLEQTRARIELMDQLIGAAQGNGNDQ